MALFDNMDFRSIMQNRISNRKSLFNPYLRIQLLENRMNSCLKILMDGFQPLFYHRVELETAWLFPTLFLYRSHYLQSVHSSV